MEQFRLREAMAGVIHLARLGNRYLAETEPWKLLKTDSEAASRVLRLAAELCAELCIALEPFLPFTASKLSNQLQWQASAQEREAWWNSGSTDSKGSIDARPRYLAKGHRLGAAALLFVPIEDELIQAQVHKLSPMNDPKPENDPKTDAELKPEVTYDQFAALDLRIATILSAQPVPGADKVLEIKVDLGDEQRTVVSGIAQHFQPEALRGKQVLMLTNLAPRKIRGIVSQG
ncbi:MAG: methionine--tRNA ligase, partial [Bacteroidota bacterium]